MLKFFSYNDDLLKAPLTSITVECVSVLVLSTYNCVNKFMVMCSSLCREKCNELFKREWSVAEIDVIVWQHFMTHYVYKNFQLDVNVLNIIVL